MKFELIVTLLLSTTALFHHVGLVAASADVSTIRGHKEIEAIKTIVKENQNLQASLLPPGGGGNTHIVAWNNNHYTYHGQCDLVMLKDEFFADGLGLHVHVRTKLVDYWSYIKTVAIRIGDDILEIEGSAHPQHDADQAHHWINYEFQGKLDTFAGFPVTQNVPSTHKRQYTIEFDSNASIVVETYKEFVRVKFHGDESIFGSAVGLLGNYKTGKTCARDGATAIDDFSTLGDKWQVLPYERRLFREASRPQYPELCIKPKDPRGERRRHLAESQISYAQAEVACFRVMSDPRSIKDCANDILATQDLEMAGAYY